MSETTKALQTLRRVLDDLLDQDLSGIDPLELPNLMAESTLIRIAASDMHERAEYLNEQHKSLARIKNS